MADGVDFLWHAEIRRIYHFEYFRGHQRIGGDAFGQIRHLDGRIIEIFLETRLSDAELIGDGLKAVDNGLNAENFATLALKSTGLETHTDIVNTLWTNVVGFAPTAEQAQPYIIKLDSGEWSIGKLVLEAADNSLNEANINLVGLMSHGIEFS